MVFFFSFLVFLSLSSFFIVNCVSLLLILKRIAYNTSDSWVLNYMRLYKLCYFFKYFMHCVILFNFFKGLKKQKLKHFHLVIFYYLFIFWVLMVQFNLLYIKKYKSGAWRTQEKKRGTWEKPEAWHLQKLQKKLRKWKFCRISMWTSSEMVVV
jgi:hypothetical protein